MEILQATVLEWVAMPSSRGSSQPKGRTQVSFIAGGFFTVWATREAQFKNRHSQKELIIQIMELGYICWSLDSILD